MLRRICTILVGLAMVLTGTVALAPTANASHTDCTSWPVQEYTFHLSWADGYLCSDLNPPYTQYGPYSSDDVADGHCTHLYYNLTWTNVGFQEIHETCGVGTSVLGPYLSFNPPCGNGVDDKITWKWTDGGGGHSKSYVDDPPDCA